MKKCQCNEYPEVDPKNDFPCGNEAKYYSGFLGIYISANCLGGLVADFADNGQDMQLKEVE